MLRVYYASVLCLALAACDAKTNSSQAPSRPPPAPETWMYTSKPDPMTGKLVRAACIVSNESVHLAPPYTPTKAELCLTAIGDEFPVATFQLQGEGQIVCGTECEMPVRFEPKELSSSYASAPRDGSANRVVFDMAGSLHVIAGVLDAKRTLIQATYFQNGAQVSTFNTAGFDPTRIESPKV
jgi:hypothetical protein